jgi:hypothetical protein
MVTSAPASRHNQPDVRPAMPLPITAILFFISASSFMIKY